MFFLGVDPGASGGIAVIDEDGKVELHATTTERETWDFLELLGLRREGKVAVLEGVHAFPGDGVSSVFKFGMSYGGLRMALVAASIPFVTATPQEWQRHFGLYRLPDETKSKYKGRLLAYAVRKFPQVEKIVRPVCDALLLAEYARIHYPKGLSSTTKDSPRN